MNTPKVVKTITSQTRMTDAQIGNVLAEVERQGRSKADYIADTRKLKAVVADKSLLISVPAQGVDTLLTIKPTAQRQMAQAWKVPGDYFSRLLADPKHLPLAATTLNHFFQADPSKRMVRTLDGGVRAFLSNKYRPLDNADLFFMAMEELQKVKAEPWYVRLTDDSFRIYAVAEGTSAEVTTARPFGEGHDIKHFGTGGAGGTGGAPDIHHPAISIENSETGEGGLRVRAADLRTACTNLLVSDMGVMAIHSGTRKEEEGFLSAETTAAEAKVVWMKTRDLIRATFDPAKFKSLVDLMNGATQEEVVDAVKTVEALAELNYIPGDVKDSIRNRFINGGDKSRYGLIQAVTFEANNGDLVAEKRNMLNDAGGKLLSTTVQKLLVAAGAR
jgi:hypothetical protein